MSNLKEKAKTVLKLLRETPYPHGFGEQNKFVLLSDAEAALNSTQSEIQQLKDQLKDITAVELKLGELQARVEAAKKIFKEQLLSDIITEKDYIEIMQILAGETKDPLEKALPKTELPNGWDEKWSSIIRKKKESAQNSG